MCDFEVNRQEILDGYAVSAKRLDGLFSDAVAAFPGMLKPTEAGLFIPKAARPLTRMIARNFDAYDLSKAGHSSAI